MDHPLTLKLFITGIIIETVIAIFAVHFSIAHVNGVNYNSSLPSPTNWLGILSWCLSASTFGLSGQWANISPIFEWLFFVCNLLIWPQIFEWFIQCVNLIF